MYIYTTKLIYWQLLLWGVHIGHSFRNSIIFSSWLIYTYRQNILIINLFKTIWLIKNGYTALTASIKLLGPIWFINLNKNMELFTVYSAKQAAEISYTCHWMHGMISNWITFGLTFQKFNRLIYTANKAQFKKLEWNWQPWLEARISWPRTTFISSVSSSPWAAKECLTAGIPCLGIIDTDISGHLSNIPIPGNDDSIDSLLFYNTHISQYILEKKFSNCIKWFLNIRRNKRIFKFSEWLFINYINHKGKLSTTKINAQNDFNSNSVKGYKNIIQKKNFFNISTFWYLGLKFFFSRNFGLAIKKEQVDIYNLEKIKLTLTRTFMLIKNYSIFLTKLLNIFYIKTIWKNKQFLKKNIFSFKNLKLKFLTGYYNYLSKNWRGTNNYFYQRFLTNKIYKTYLKQNKLRFNKYILNFIKFFFLNKFIVYRGWFSDFSMNLINKSKLSYVSLFFCSQNFKNFIFNPLKKITNFNKLKLKKKFIKISQKINYLKYNIKINLNKLLKNKSINKLKKNYIFFKNYYIFNNLNNKFNNKIYIYYLFFFNFYLWNNNLKKINVKTIILANRLKNFYKNNLNRLNYFYKKTFKHINDLSKNYKLVKKNIIFIRNLKLINKEFSSFKIIGENFDKIDYIWQTLKKNIFNNLKTYRYNKKILKCDKQKRFLYIKNKYWFINIKDKLLWQLYKPYILNLSQKKIVYNKIIFYNDIYKNLNKYKILKLKLNKNLNPNKLNYIIKNKFVLNNQMKSYKNYYDKNYNLHKFYLKKKPCFYNKNFLYKTKASKINFIESKNLNKIKKAIFLNNEIIKHILNNNSWKFNKNYLSYIKNIKNLKHKNHFYLFNIYFFKLSHYKKFFW